MNILIKWLIATVGIMLIGYFLPTVTVSGLWAALWAALFLGLVNAVLRPILVLLTLPINILTLGLFTFVINALLIMLVSSVVQGFTVEGFWTAVLFSIILSVFSYALNTLFKGAKEKS
ncbi:MAG: phage holin family protein [Patescibacteria group bacterium]|nr:MAG: phage holin family protein [Patescibacteria group bacterium]